MKLNASQIENLYKFTRQHYVYHYDVQSELVDHLANDIEQIWEENPKISFENARDKSFKKFGIFGFMNVVEAKQKQMNKRYWKILWRFIKEWFQLPKIILTTLIFISFYFLFNSTLSSKILLGLILILSTYEIYISWKLRQKRKNQEEKTFLLEAMIGNASNSFTLLTLVNLFHIVNLVDSNIHLLSTYWIILISFLVTLFSIASYITSVIIPKKAQELLEETYPEYKMIKKM